MGMGAAKPGSTLPPQGGKGGVQQPNRPGQVPLQGGKPAAPGTIFNPRNPRNIPMPGGKGGGTIYPKPVPSQGGKGGGIPPQGGKGNMPLPSHYQSPYASYGFDSGLQSYLDQQNYRSATDAGTSFQYDPATQTFTGGTMAGRYNPIPLSVMQQVAGGNRDVLSSYFQPRFQQTQPTTPKPIIPTPITPTAPTPTPTPIVPPPTPTAPPPGSFQAMRAGGLAALRKS